METSWRSGGNGGGKVAAMPQHTENAAGTAAVCQLVNPRRFFS